MLKAIKCTKAFSLNVFTAFRMSNIHFNKTEKARNGAISLADIASVRTPLSSFKNLARFQSLQKNYSRLKFNGNHATYICLPLN